jgi:hypothetical protein
VGLAFAFTTVTVNLNFPLHSSELISTASAHQMQPHPNANSHNSGQDEKALLQERMLQLKKMMNPGAKIGGHTGRNSDHGQRQTHRTSRADIVNKMNLQQQKMEKNTEPVTYLNGNTGETLNQKVFQRNSNLDQQFNQLEQQPGTSQTSLLDNNAGLELKELESQQSILNRERKDENNSKFQNKDSNDFHLQNQDFNLQLDKMDTLNFSELGEKITTEGPKVKGGRNGGRVKGGYYKSKGQKVNPKLQHFDPFMPGAGVDGHDGYGAEKQNLNQNQKLTLQQQYMRQQHLNEVNQEGNQQQHLNEGNQQVNQESLGQQAGFGGLNLNHRLQSKATAAPGEGDELKSGVGFRDIDEDDEEFGIFNVGFRGQGQVRGVDHIQDGLLILDLILFKYIYYFAV